ADLAFALPPMALSQLSDDTLKEHWRAIHAHFLPNEPYFGRELTLSERLDIAPLDLPVRRLARQIGGRPDAEIRPRANVSGLLKESLWYQTVVAGIARLEDERATPEAAEKVIKSVLAEEGRRLQIPVILAIPGVAPTYVRNAYGSTARDRA